MLKNVKKIRNTVISYSIILTMTVCCVLLFLLGIGNRQNDQLSDRIFQQGGSTSGNIFILQIDAHSLEELGPYQTWTRDYVAEAIEKLNEDAETAPAVIGVDILYIGETNKASDAHLVNACSQSKNVVMGSFLNFDTAISQDREGNYYLADTISLYEEPFEALKSVTTQGFVNGFADDDGVIRHGLQKISVPGIGEVPSFSYAVYRKYAGQNDLPEDIDIPENEKGYWYLNY